MHQRIFCIILFVVLLHIQLISCQCRVYKLKPAARQLQVNIEHVTCGQRSINISFVYKGNSSNAIFHIVPQKKDLFIFSLRQKLSDIVPKQRIEIQINVTQENLPTKVAVLSSRYAVLVRCSIVFESCGSPVTIGSPMNFTSTTFRPTKPSKNFEIINKFGIWHLLYIVIPVVSVLWLTVVIACVKCARKRIQESDEDSNNNANEEKYRNAHEAKLRKFHEKLKEKGEELLEKSKRTVKVFLIFVNEHKRHEKVIINFVNFLQADLGFEVICELFANEEISLDPVSWMERSLQQADKVIVVWSPGAAKRWKNSYLDIKEDLFTPVLKKIRNDLFREVNMGKYYFGYFDYCTKDNIPKEFNFPKLNHFQLMQQFDELYFRLKGIEKYMPGGVITEDKVMFDRYFDPNLNVFGGELQQSIAEMISFVENNPKWHYDDNWSPADINALNNNLDESNIKFRELDILPPSPMKVNDTKTTSLSYLNLEKEPFKTSNPFHLVPELKGFRVERNEVICENLYSSKDKESKSNLSNVFSLSLEVNDKSTPTLQSVKDVETTKNSGEINSTKESLKSATSVNTLSSSNAYNELISTKTIPTSQLKNDFCSPLYGFHFDNVVKANHRSPVENSMFNGDEDYLRVLETKDLKLSLETATCSDGFDSGYLSGLSDSITSLPVAGDRYQKPIFHLKTVGNTYDNFIHKHVKSDSNEISILKQSTTYEKRTRYQPHVELVPFDLSSDPMLSLMKLNTIKSQ